jgi:hypothetical protein
MMIQKGGEQMTILESSFGYDMTINCYYIILKDGDKTAMLQEIGRTINSDDGLGGGNSIADPAIKKGKPFRAYKRAFPKDFHNGETYYVSRYIAGNSATVWDGKPSYYNTWD